MEDPREPPERASILLAQQSRQQIGLAVTKAKACDDPSRAEGRQRLPRHVDVRAERAVLDLQIENDFVVVSHPRGHDQVDAHGSVFERRQGVDCHAPVAIAVNDVDGTGMSSPRFKLSSMPSCPRNCGLAMSRVSESVSRKLMTAAGTAR